MYGISNKEEVANFAYVRQIDIFYALIPWFKPNTTIKSPFYPNKRPGFMTIVNPNGIVWFKDYHDDTQGTAVDLVMRLQNCDEQAANNYIRANCAITGEVVSYTKPDKKVIKIQSREWKLYDIEWWAQFGIKLSTLQEFKVTPIKFYWINEKQYSVKKHAYAWPHGKDIRIYQPFNYDFKIFGSHLDDVLQGYHFLPETGEQLIIASSYKDGMAVKEITNIPFVAPNSESVLPLDSTIRHLLKRFSKVYSLYDNDETGTRSAMILEEVYGIKPILLPWMEKDPSDFVKQNKKDILELCLKEYLTY